MVISEMVKNLFRGPAEQEKRLTMRLKKSFREKLKKLRQLLMT
jgi:hypothetical protein